MSETLTITLSDKRMAYFRKYAGRMGQRPEAVASMHMAGLIDQMKSGQQAHIYWLDKRGTIS